MCCFIYSNTTPRPITMKILPPNPRKHWAVNILFQQREFSFSCHKFQRTDNENWRPKRNRMFLVFIILTRNWGFTPRFPGTNSCEQSSMLSICCVERIFVNDISYLKCRKTIFDDLWRRNHLAYIWNNWLPEFTFRTYFIKENLFTFLTSYLFPIPPPSVCLSVCQSACLSYTHTHTHIHTHIIYTWCLQ